MSNTTVGVSRKTMDALQRIKDKSEGEIGYKMPFNAIIAGALKDKYPEEFGMGFGSVDEIGGGNG